MKQQFYKQVGNSRIFFLIFGVIIALFFSGISFSFVIPGLKGFDLFFLIFTLIMYFVASYLFLGSFHDRKWFIFMICLLLSSLGMGWRMWIEWGEVSLVEHMILTVYVGYPIVTALIIATFYSILSSYLERKV